MSLQKLFILGAGGHAKMVIEAIRSMGNADLIGCLDAKATQREILGIPIESETAEALQKMLRAGAKAMVAIGDNALRERLTRQLYELGFQFATPIAASAYVSPSATIAPGSVVMPKAAIGAMAVIGSGAIINTGATVDHDCRIGDFVHVAPGCHLAGGVAIDRGAMIGIGTCILPNVRIGPRAMVGANSTVLRDIPADSKWVGAPARPLDT